MKHALPNLVIIGAMKCGTTSLHYYLGLHPEISMSREKELNFFVTRVNWSRGVEWYRSHFRRHARIRGESSPRYTNYPLEQGVPERMHAVIPEAKLIYLVRDPIERIISDYLHLYCTRVADRPLSEALEDPDASPSVWRSKYYMQLEQYLRYFSKENILVLAQKDLYENRVETLKRVFRFLNVDDSFYTSRFRVVKHRTKNQRRKDDVGVLVERLVGKRMTEQIPPPARRYLERALYFAFSSKVERPIINESLRRELQRVLREDTERLREYTGSSFAQWSV